MIKITVNTDELDAAIAEFTALNQDNTVITRPMAAILAASSARAFKEQANPATGEAWEPLSPVTIARRLKMGKGSTPILQISGALMGHIQQEYGQDYALAGSPEKYSGTQFFGAGKGSFGADRHGRPIPWGDIPARPFLGLGPVEEEDILDLLERKLVACFKAK